MRIFLSACQFFFVTSAVVAQINPTKWSFTSKKINAGLYEIHLKVTIEKPWHIYSQRTPAGGPNPTVIRINQNPLIKPEGKAKEVGKSFNKFEEVFKVNVIYYENQVEFVQQIKVKGGVLTNCSGQISYMICKDEMCLPPATETFNIPLR